MNTEKLIKLLNLTTSGNDHEALVAIRMANEMLRVSEFSWDQLINIETKKEAQGGASEETDYRRMVAILLSMAELLPAIDRSFIVKFSDAIDEGEEPSPYAIRKVQKIYANFGNFWDKGV